MLNRRRRRWLGHLAVVLPVGILTSACSLVSGWSDLQTETGRSQARRDAATDDRPPIPTPPDDAGGQSAADVAPPQRGVDCNGTICPAGTGCCDDGTIRSCLTEDSCVNEQGGTWVTCDSQDFCAGQAKSICCYHLTRDAVTCEATCGDTFQDRICRAGERCPDGQACIPSGIGATALGRCF